MKVTVMILIAGLIMFGSSFYPSYGDEVCQVEQIVEKPTADKGIKTMAQVDLWAQADTCVCYCEGKQFQPSGQACMGGGFLHKCNDRPLGSKRNCGWEPIMESGNQKPCRGTC